MIKKFSSAVAATTLGLTLFAGGVAHSAEDTRPVRGTEACTDRVESSLEVSTASSNVDTARVTLQQIEADTESTTAQRLAAQQDVQKRVSLLAIARQNQTALLCRTGTVTPAPTTTVVTPAPTTVVQRPTTVVERPTVIDRERVSTVAVVPTRDDNSVAVTSGSQVSVVPEGSASTGQA